MKRGLVMLAMTMIASASAFAQVESTDLGEPGTAPPPKAKTEAPAKQSPPPAAESKPAEDKPKTTKPSHSRKVAAFWIIVP